MYHQDKDITVMCVEAASFPDGVKEAHKKLRSRLPSVEGRTFYGISRPAGSRGIVYKAAAKEAYEGEAEKYGCETFIIKEGDYLSETLTDWDEDEGLIAQTFQKLLADSRIDPEGYCLEVYVGDDEMRCMVPIKCSRSTH